METEKNGSNSSSDFLSKQLMDWRTQLARLQGVMDEHKEKAHKGLVKSSCRTCIINNRDILWLEEDISMIEGSINTEL